MSNLCTQCLRRAWIQEAPARELLRRHTSRYLSTTRSLGQDESRDTSMGIQTAQVQRRPGPRNPEQGPRITRVNMKERQGPRIAKVEAKEVRISKHEVEQKEGPTITKFYSREKQDRARTSPSSPSTATESPPTSQVLQRSSPLPSSSTTTSGSPSTSQVVQRSRPAYHSPLDNVAPSRESHGGLRVGSGSLLRRTSAPRRPPGTSSSSPSSPQARAGQGRPSDRRSGRPGGPRPSSGGAPQRRRPTRRVSNDDFAEDPTLPSDEEVMDRMFPPPHDEVVGPAVPHQPLTHTVDSLRSDFPPIPTSSVAAMEAVQQRMDWLARRLPHGYIGADHLAEQYARGELVRFDSEEEKEVVLSMAAHMAGGAQDQTREDMGFVDAKSSTTPTSATGGQSTDASQLADTMIRGIYADLPPQSSSPASSAQQQTAFLSNGIAALALRNNGTYGTDKNKRFVDKVLSVLARGAAPMKEPRKLEF